MKPVDVDADREDAGLHLSTEGFQRIVRHSNFASSPRASEMT
jgi:hypothetical protein